MKHNPEFTMLEFYCAYMDVNGMMDFADRDDSGSCAESDRRKFEVKYEGNEIDF